MDYEREIRFTLQDLRCQALTQFMNEFMQVLTAEGYTLGDLLDAVTSLVSEKPELESVVKHLENAEQELRSKSTAGHGSSLLGGLKSITQ